MREWAHVRVFSPWRYNVDAVAVAMLTKSGWTMPDPTTCRPDGSSLRSISSRSPRSRRSSRLSGWGLGSSASAVAAWTSSGRTAVTAAPFVLRVRTTNGQEQEILARAVIDASGTSGSPNPLGADGHVRPRTSPAWATASSTGSPTCWRSTAHRYAGRRVAVVGSGHSALNTLLDLAELATAAPRTAITWIVRRPPPARVFGGGVADALPARGALGQHARQLLDRGGVALVVGRVAALARTPQGVVILDEAGSTLAVVDEVVAVTGLRPT